jgi:hypothetical protein
VCHKIGFQKMGKKYIEINVNKNPHDRDLTFVSDPVKELMQQRHPKQPVNDNNSSTSKYDDDKQKLVKRARLDRFSGRDLQKNKSKQSLSKQTHSPIYE